MANACLAIGIRSSSDSCAAWIPSFPEKLKLHLVLDNYGTHKHPKVESWLQRHPRFALHFIPTSSSWLNQVERWFGELTQKAVRRGAFVSVGELQKVIEEFLSA